MDGASEGVGAIDSRLDLCHLRPGSDNRIGGKRWPVTAKELGRLDVHNLRRGGDCATGLQHVHSGRAKGHGTIGTHPIRSCRYYPRGSAVVLEVRS